MARLKRVILIGDHHQLPPVVKNMAFQKYSHLDQSLFTRFVRLGTPYVQLNAQVPFCSPCSLLTSLLPERSLHCLLCNPLSALAASRCCAHSTHHDCCSCQQHAINYYLHNAEH